MPDLTRLVPREQYVGRLEHPETLPDGRHLIVSAEVQEVVARLRDGEPTVGWEGDPRLALYRAEGADHWELWRMEADGQYRPIIRSKPGVSLMGLIRWLVAHDTRRGHDPAAEVNAHNVARQSGLDERARSKMIDALDRVAFAIQKDLGGQTDIGSGSWHAGDLDGSEVG